jgi:hypothetical protein
LGLVLNWSRLKSLLGKYLYKAGITSCPYWANHYKYIIGKEQVLKLQESITLTFLKAAMRNQRIGK